MKVFQPFRLDTGNHCLWRGEERVPLTPKAFDVLRFLVERAERVVTPDEILEALWPGTFVNPEVIKKYVLEIRRVLGDQRDPPIFVETVHKRGYRFIARVRDDRDGPAAEAETEPVIGVVGREAVMAKLDDHLKRTMSLRRQIIFVTGEAGIGKTTLIDIFQRKVAGHLIRIARGQCVEGFGGKEAYYPVLEALGQLTRDSDHNAVVQVLGQRAPTWLIQFPSLVKPEQREMLQRKSWARRASECCERCAKP